MEIFIRVKTKEQLDVIKQTGVEACLISDFKSGLDTEGIVIDNYDELALLIEEKNKQKLSQENSESVSKDVRVFAGELLYSYNAEAISFFRSNIPDMEFLAPQELTLNELKALENKAAVQFIYKIYGHQLLMVTNQCFRKNYLECESGKSLGTPLMFKNENGTFYAVNDCRTCINYVYNGTPAFMFDKLNEFKKMDGSLKLFVDFTIESKEEIKKILGQFEAAISGKVETTKSCTRGHYYRGID